MSKFIIIGDVHIGAREANMDVMEHQLRFYEEQLFPFMKANGMKFILQLGDLFDKRKFTNHVVLYWWKKRFFDVMKANGVKFVTILGNHDVAYKNTLEVNTTTLFCEQYDNIIIIDRPTDLNIHGTDFILTPWVCDDNRADIEEAVAVTDAKFCAGHFEFDGFAISQSQVCTQGEDAEIYSKFDTVFSGHFHTRSAQKNVLYTGTPYELTWIDYNDPKGFYVFDTEDDSYEFVRNEKPLFVRIEYNDKDAGEDYHSSIDVSDVPKSYVKLVVGCKTDPYQFDKFVEKIVRLSPIDLKILDELDGFDEVELDEGEHEEILAIETTDLIEMFIEQTVTELDKSKIITNLKNLHVEALHLL